MTSEPPAAQRRSAIRRDLARRVLVAFTAAFLATRVLVLLIMTRAIPDLYVHLGGTHVHHMNWGILLLALSGGMLLFLPASERLLRRMAIVYGIGLALTFDEFGMWLHLGGSYWQRASFDAIVVVAGLLGIVAYAPALPRLRPRHVWTALLLATGTGVFGWLLLRSFAFVGDRLGPELQRIESQEPR